MFDKSLKDRGEKYNLEIRSRHRETLKRFWYTHPDKRDWYVIKFFTQVTKASNSRLFPRCECGSDNSAEHTVNRCISVKLDRYKYIEEFQRIYADEGQGKLVEDFALYSFLEYTYFTADLFNMKSKSRQRLVDMTKRIIFLVVIKKAELDL